MAGWIRGCRYELKCAWWAGWRAVSSSAEGFLRNATPSASGPALTGTRILRCWSTLSWLATPPHVKTPHSHSQPRRDRRLADEPVPLTIAARIGPETRALSGLQFTPRNRAPPKPSAATAWLAAPTLHGQPFQPRPSLRALAT